MQAIRPRILVIDDDPLIQNLLGATLTTAGYELTRADTGAAGLAQIVNHPSDLVILDLGLSDMDGTEVLRRARDLYGGPIVILSERDEEEEKIAALDLGADDYVCKPFHVGELLARLRVALRRRVERPGPTVVVRAGEIRIDLQKRLVTRGGLPVRLSAREYDLLARLAEVSGKVLTHQQLLTIGWPRANMDNLQYLRIYIRRLRQKLEVDPSLPKCLVTEGGVGYRLVVSRPNRARGAH